MDTLFATFGSGNCFKAHLAFEQLNIEHNVKWIDVLSGESRQAEYLAINPTGTVPLLLTQSGEAITESNSICWYLCQGSPLAPSNSVEQAQTIDWMIFEQTKLEPFISPARFFTTILPDKREEMRGQISEWQTAGSPGLRRLDQHLSIHDFMVGNHYSVADIAVFGYTHLAGEGGFEMERYPGIQNWIGRVKNTLDYREILDFKAAA